MCAMQIRHMGGLGRWFLNRPNKLEETRVRRGVGVRRLFACRYHVGTRSADPFLRFRASFVCCRERSSSPTSPPT